MIGVYIYTIESPFGKEVARKPFIEGISYLDSKASRKREYQRFASYLFDNGAELLHRHYIVRSHNIFYYGFKKIMRFLVFSR